MMTDADTRTDEEKLAEEAGALARKLAADIDGRLREHLVKHLSNTGRAGLVADILNCFVSTETMLRGLPKLVDAFEGEAGLADVEMHRMRLGAELRKMRAAGIGAEEVTAFREFVNGCYDHALPILKTMDTMTKTMRALAKTQMGLARGLQAQNAALLAYVLSQNSAKDATLSLLILSRAENLVGEAVKKMAEEPPKAP